jgi:hypothetical protein
VARSAEARKVLADLDAELVLASKRRGVTGEWSASERAVLRLISATIDRKSGLAREYARTEDVSLRVKLSAELRLLEAQQARLLKQVTPDVPDVQRESPTQRKARNAANARWERVRAQG